MLHCLRITIYFQLKIKKKFQSHSSGTTSLSQSKINLDPKTSLLQSKALGKIFKNINKDKDIFFIEKNFLRTKESMSAKGAAIKGFSQLQKAFSFK